MAFEKDNHHFLPRFWLRGFRDANNVLYARYRADAKAKVVGISNVMRGDWLYTIFDSQWNPSDDLENALSKIEGDDAKLFRRVCTSGVLTANDRKGLCSALALQACRHPDVMKRGNRQAQELGNAFIEVYTLAEPEFAARLSEFGITASDAITIRQQLLTKSHDELTCELTELKSLSPQDHQLPEQLALLADTQVEKAISRMELTLLDAPPGNFFVLGDTPLPQSELARGFEVPLSKKMALQARPSATPQTQVLRRPALPNEVATINRTQWNNSVDVTVGPSKLLLEEF